MCMKLDARQAHSFRDIRACLVFSGRWNATGMEKFLQNSKKSQRSIIKEKANRIEWSNVSCAIADAAPFRFIQYYKEVYTWVVILLWNRWNNETIKSLKYCIYSALRPDYESSLKIFRLIFDYLFIYLPLSYSVLVCICLFHFVIAKITRSIEHKHHKENKQYVKNTDTKQQLSIFVTRKL